MANGFDYESPLNRLLSVTLPQFVSIMNVIDKKVLGVLMQQMAVER